MLAGHHITAYTRRHTKYYINAGQASQMVDQH